MGIRWQITGVFAAVVVACVVPPASHGAISSWTMEKSTVPGVPDTAFTWAANDPTVEEISTNAYIGRIAQTPTTSKWSYALLNTGELTNAANGATIPATALYTKLTSSGSWVRIDVSRTLQNNIAIATTTTSPFHFRILPPAGTRAGHYVGTIRLRATAGTPTADVFISVTAQVNAVMVGAASNLHNSGHTVPAALTFPATAPESSSSAQGPYHFHITDTNEPWTLQLSATNLTAGLNSMPQSAIEVQGPDQGATWAPLPVTVDTMLATENVTGNFYLRLTPPAGQPPGDYGGTVTLTATTA